MNDKIKAELTPTRIEGAAIWKRRAIERKTRDREKNNTDHLTGLLNRRIFTERLETEIARSQRLKHPLTLMFIDVDKLKDVNDYKGHLEGDKVLKKVAELLKEKFKRATDTAFRWGGDEFAVILAGEHVKDVAQRTDDVREFIAKGIEELGLNENKGDGNIDVHPTISIGLAEHIKGQSISKFLGFADNALYRAKDKGGGQVAVTNAKGESLLLRDFKAANQ